MRYFNMKQYKSKIKADNEEGKAIVFEVKKILNKLSEKTYEKLTAQLKTHCEKNIDESIMEEIIDLIFGITKKINCMPKCLVNSIKILVYELRFQLMLYTKKILH